MESAVLALVGVLVGGFSAHILDRFRRRELREEERRRDLRRMVEAVMHLARSQQAARIFLQLTLISGQGLQEWREQHGQDVQEIWSRYPDFFWRPGRIKDKTLRKRATDLQFANAEATQLMRQALRTAKATPEWTAAAARVMNQIKRHLDDVDERLGELDG